MAVPFEADVFIRSIYIRDLPVALHGPPDDRARPRELSRAGARFADAG
jgi:hypothetical protein